MNLAQYLLRSLAGSALAGFAVGTIAAVATARTTDSIQTPAQAVILVAILGTVFAAIFTALGLVLTLVTDRLRERGQETPDERRGVALQVGVSLFLLWSILVGGLFLHDIRLGSPLPGLIVRPLGNMAVMSPSLTLTEDEIDEIAAILRGSISAVIDDLGKEGLL